MSRADEILNANEYDVHYYGGGRRDILDAMELFAKETAIGFFGWYATKMVGFIEYIKDIRPIVTSNEIEEKLKEFEGQTLDNLYQQYLISIEQQNPQP